MKLIVPEYCGKEHIYTNKIPLRLVRRWIPKSKSAFGRGPQITMYEANGQFYHYKQGMIEWISTEEPNVVGSYTIQEYE